MIRDPHATVIGHFRLAPGAPDTPRVGDIFKLTGKVRVTEVVEESSQGNLLIVRVALKSTEAQLTPE